MDDITHQLGGVLLPFVLGGLASQHSIVILNGVTQLTPPPQPYINIFTKQSHCYAWEAYEFGYGERSGALAPGNRDSTSTSKLRIYICVYICQYIYSPWLIGLITQIREEKMANKSSQGFTEGCGFSNLFLFFSPFFTLSLTQTHQQKFSN